MGESENQPEDRQDLSPQDEPEPILAEQEPAPEPDQEAEAEDTGTQALARALHASFTVLKLGMIALVLIYVVRGVFYVKPQEVRVKLRFGNVVRSWGQIVLKPGTVHIKWPWEDVETVATSEKIVELGDVYWTNWQQGPKRQSLDVRNDGYLLTGDANIVHMRVKVRCRARGDTDGALAYKFAVERPEEILRRCLMTAITRVVGSMEVMDVLKREALFPRITQHLRARLANFEQKAGVPLGLEVIAVEAVDVENVKNPTEPLAGPVRAAFLQAQNAGSVKDKLVEEGKLQANALIESAQARARERIADARGEAARLVGSAQADAEAMRRLLPIYANSDEEAHILRETMYQRTLTYVLHNAKSVFVLHDPPDGTDRELRLILGGTTLPRRPQIEIPEEMMEP